MCLRDAGKTIVKVILQIKDASALVFTDDTDNLRLLINHVNISQKQNDIYIKNMTKKKESNERVCYRLHDVIDNLDPLIIKFSSFCLLMPTQSVIRHQLSIILGSKQFFPKLELPTRYNKSFSSFFLTTYLQKQLVMDLSVASKNSISQVVVSNKFER